MERGLHSGRNDCQPADFSGPELPRPDLEDPGGVGVAVAGRDGLHQKRQSKVFLGQPAREAEGRLAQPVPEGEFRPQTSKIFILIDFHESFTAIVNIL